MNTCCMHTMLLMSCHMEDIFLIIFGTYKQSLLKVVLLYVNFTAVTTVAEKSRCFENEILKIWAPY